MPGTLLGSCRARIGYAVSHSVAGPDFNGNVGLVGNLHQLIDKGQHKAIVIRTGDIFKVAAGTQAVIQPRR